MERAGERSLFRLWGGVGIFWSFTPLWIGGCIYIMYTREGGAEWKKFSPIFGGTGIFALSLQSQTKRGARETDKMMDEKITSVVLVV